MQGRRGLRMPDLDTAAEPLAEIYRVTDPDLRGVDLVGPDFEPREPRAAP
jgi:hypothetical protein